MEEDDVPAPLSPCLPQSLGRFTDVTVGHGRIRSGIPRVLRVVAVQGDFPSCPPGGYRPHGGMTRLPEKGEHGAPTLPRPMTPYLYLIDQPWVLTCSNRSQSMAKEHSAMVFRTICLYCSSSM